MKKAILVTVLLVISVSVAGVFYIRHQTSIGQALPQPSTASNSETGSDIALTASGDPAEPNSELENRLAVKFLELYGETIDHPATQAKLLQELERLLGFYPKKGYALFEAAVGIAFPELKDEIMSLVSRLVLYYQWKEDNRRALQAMAVLQRKSTLWQKREEMFGEDARLIWAEEQEELEEQQQVVKQELDRLDQNFNITPEETVYQLQTTINEVYGDGFARQFIGPEVMATTLFGLESIQSHLASMPAEERQQKINKLRRELGFDDEAIEHMEAIDQERNEKWQKGYEYMAEREELSQRYSGEQLENELETLREDHFGSSAETISREEEDGFFRFERKRRFGLN